MTVWQCRICGFLYDEKAGMPEHGIPVGTAWQKVSDDWLCPECGMSKADFDLVELVA
ncbi:MAG TPA: rubredoxin [Variovorax sp.]|nr:rubredoxin [Variovorax sp.]